MKFALLATAIAAHTNELHTFEVMKNGGLEQFGDGLGATGVVTWSQCPDDTGVWTFDTAASTYSPSPFEKGNTVSFTLLGSVTAPIHIDMYSVSVKLNGSLYIFETFGGGDFTSAWSLSLSQKFPALLTPSGHYQITAVGNGGLQNGENGTVTCGNAEFDL